MNISWKLQEMSSMLNSHLHLKHFWFVLLKNPPWGSLTLAETTLSALSWPTRVLLTAHASGGVKGLWTNVKFRDTKHRNITCICWNITSLVYHKPTTVQVWYISILHFPDPWSIFVLQRRFLHLSRGVVIAPTYFQHGNHIWNSYSDRWPSSQSFCQLWDIIWYYVHGLEGHFANGNGHILSVWSTIQANYEQTIPAVTGTATAMVYTLFFVLGYNSPSPCNPDAKQMHVLFHISKM